MPFNLLGSISKALKIESNSSNVNTKSISPAISESFASAFLAIQGPINTTLASGFNFFIRWKSSNKCLLQRM